MNKVWLIVNKMTGEFSWGVGEDCWCPNQTGVEQLGCRSLNLKQVVCTSGRWQHCSVLRSSLVHGLNEVVSFKYVFWKLYLIRVLSLDNGGGAMDLLMDVDAPRGEGLPGINAPKHWKNDPERFSIFVYDRIQVHFCLFRIISIFMIPCSGYTFAEFCFCLPNLV